MNAYKWIKTVSAIAVASGLLAGCASTNGKALYGSDKKAQEKRDRDAMLGAMPWVPLGLSRNGFITSEKRLIKHVRVGMPREDFLDHMKLTPVNGLELSDRVTWGEGWFSELSRRNKYGQVDVEEFPFGYYEGHRLKERFVVVLNNDAVSRIVHSPWGEGRSTPKPPKTIFSPDNSLEEENRMVKDFYRKKLQTLSAFRRILPQLKRVRPGWTSAEIRLNLGGSLYRLPNGLVYFQEGLLWDDGFVQSANDLSSVVIMPFGYRQSDGSMKTRVIIRAEGGVVTAVYWQAEAPQQEKTETKPPDSDEKTLSQK